MTTTPPLSPRSVKRPLPRQRGGFALITTVSILVLLAVIAIGLLSLSSVTLRASVQGSALAEARSNARLALMIAIGELQKEMGPDMRVSAEAALFDTDHETPEIDGVSQARWMASYDSWGDWLNNTYSPPGTRNALSIADTYVPRREPMFRRWLVSLPEDLATDPEAPLETTSFEPDKWVTLVGEGTLGADYARSNPEQLARAFLVPVEQNGKKGRHAWWIAPENHKARIGLAAEERELAADDWEVSQGNTAEVAVGSLDGFDPLDDDPGLADRLISRPTLALADIGAEDAAASFHHLTSHSRGVLASVRTGHLKKDLSLLFELDNAELPDLYRFDQRNGIREPSIRPMSPELASLPKLPNRHFQSWTNMRHFYRMYRGDDTDASSGDMENSGTLEWDRAEPFSEAQMPLIYRDTSNSNQWLGQNSYLRLPILAKLTFIYSLMTREAGGSGREGDPKRYQLYMVYTPVFTYWNPYNVELRIPDNIMGSLSSTYQVLPMGTQFYLGSRPQGTSSTLFSGNAHSFLRAGRGRDIVFRPGEFKVFSHEAVRGQGGGQADPLSLEPGFDPRSYGGDLLRVGGNQTYTEDQRPGLLIQFSHSEWGGNVNYGNTPGSLCHTPFWLADSSRRIDAYQWNLPVMYQNDWFNLDQTYTPLIRPTPGDIARWVFSDSDPVPVAYAQLVIKGLSEFNYESIRWARDWRCRNWLQAPPFYFGSGMYISEESAIAHTQRIDNPYVMNFGPASNAELPKIVFHIGETAFLGSGSNPFEKVGAVPALELPTAPVGSLAGFAGMRINPGWVHPTTANGDWSLDSRGGNSTGKASYSFALAKTLAYQSGVTGPGIGNSYLHPMLERSEVYRHVNNSVSADPGDRRSPLANISYNDTKAYCDYWDHAFLLNDALWDDYFVSSLADQERPRGGGGDTLRRNLDRFTAGEPLANSRYVLHEAGRSPDEITRDLEAADGYLKAAAHMMVDGMFNVNSTSEDAWFALFSGIRERKIYYSDPDGTLRPVDIPADRTIALSRFNTPTSASENTDPESGVNREDGLPAWSGVRFLDDEQLRKLAQECVKQVKRRGPFLNYAEFINRRLSNDELGLMGALQSAIDYDDDSPEQGSINYPFKNGPGFMMEADDLGSGRGHVFGTPEAVNGSRFAGIPGYVIQSDLLKPVANTLSVRDDTFLIRAYGEANDADGQVVARAWCEAVVQRLPAYADPTDAPEEPARLMTADGEFRENPDLGIINRRFGRRFVIESFRWLSKEEVLGAQEA